jgi:hypothetical protein
MLRISWVAAQLAASQGGLSPSKLVIRKRVTFEIVNDWLSASFLLGGISKWNEVLFLACYTVRLSRCSNVSEMHAASIFRVWVCRLISCCVYEARCFWKARGRIGLEWEFVPPLVQQQCARIFVQMALLRTINTAEGNTAPFLGPSKGRLHKSACLLLLLNERRDKSPVYPPSLLSLQSRMLYRHSYWQKYTLCLWRWGTVYPRNIRNNAHNHVV